MEKIVAQPCVAHARLLATRPSTRGADSPWPSRPEIRRRKFRRFPRARCCSPRFSPASRWCRRCPCFRRLPWDPCGSCTGRFIANCPFRTVSPANILEHENVAVGAQVRVANRMRCNPCPARKFRKECAPSGSAAAASHLSACKSRCAASRRRASGSSLLFSRTASAGPAALSLAPAPVAAPTQQRHCHNTNRFPLSFKTHHHPCPRFSRPRNRRENTTPIPSLSISWHGDRSLGAEIWQTAIRGFL